MNVIFGSAGFAKEVDWLIDEIYRSGGVDYRPSYFVAEENNVYIGEMINGATIIAESEFFQIVENRSIYNCFFAVGNPVIRGKIVEKVKINLPKDRFPNVHFPNIIHPDVTYDKRENKVTFGEGTIIVSKNVITTDIKVGDFVHLNMDCTVGHDSIIDNFCTISPGVHISGNVHLEDRVFIGTGANILEKIFVCSGTIIGAGSTVVKSITEPGTYAGVPAKRIK